MVNILLLSVVYYSNFRMCAPSSFLRHASRDALVAKEQGELNQLAAGFSGGPGWGTTT